MTEHIHLQLNITARQQGTNKWTLTVAQLTHKKIVCHNFIKYWPMFKMLSPAVSMKNAIKTAVEPVGGWTTESVTHGQCNARPTVTFPAAERRRPLAGTKLYCLVTEARGCEQLAQSCYSVADRPRVELAASRSRANALTTEPPKKKQENMLQKSSHFSL